MNADHYAFECSIRGTCPRCGHVCDYSCMCPNGDPLFPLVPYDNPVAIAARRKDPMLSQSEIRLEQMRDNPNGIVMERELAELNTWIWHHCGLFDTEEGRHKFCKFLNGRIKDRFRPRDPNDIDYR